MPMIKNDAEFDMIMSNLMAEAADEVAEKAVQLVIKHVNAVVYGQASKNGWYDRTKEFLDSWSVIERQLLGKRVMIEFGYNPVGDDGKEDRMESIPDEWKHGSNYWSGGTDSRAVLADFIFKGVTETHSLWGELPARDAWTPFKAEFDSKWSGWWLMALKTRGLI